MNKLIGTYLITAVFAAFSLLPFSVSAGIRSEIIIDANGNVSAKNVKVFMVPEPGKSTFFYARAYWDDIFIRMTILTDDKTVITKKYGEKSSVFDIKEGDMVSVEGVFPTSADSLNIKASKITDLSLERESKEISGKITSIDSSLSSFSVFTSKGYSIKVNILGTPITKGVRTIGAGELAAGDRVLSITGIFDYRTDTIDADKITIYQDNVVFYPRNFQGTLKGLSGTSLPTTATVTVSGKDYIVHLSDKAEILSRSRAKTNLTRFVAGDTVRFYGSIRPTDLSAVDAEIIRDMNF